LPKQRSRRPWEALYLDGPAPWDVGYPQPAVVRVAAGGGFAGTVLDVGCGTGENALYIAGQGLKVLGIDVAPTALALARAKADARGVQADFAPADGLHLRRLGRKFQTVLDCGLFHTLDDEERGQYVASLAAATENGGALHVLCFSDEGPDTGPHPVGREQLAAAFAPSTGWEIASIRHERLRTRFHGEDGAPAWLATVERSAGRP
jgi:SAM-dependent methyltransferase